MGMKFNPLDTGGGGSNHFSATPTDINTTASALAEHAKTIADARRYGAVSGVGDYTDVANAASAMTATWNPALDAWERSLGSFSGAVSGAAAAITGTDENLGRAWTASALMMGGDR